MLLDCRAGAIARGPKRSEARVHGSGVTEVSLSFCPAEPMLLFYKSHVASELIQSTVVIFTVCNESIDF